MNKINFELTDLNVLLFLTNKSGGCDRTKLSKSFLEKNPEFKYYLDNRFDYIETYGEVFHRLKHNLEIRPTCIECGNKVQYIGMANGKYNFGYRQFCCAKCANKSAIRLRRMEETCLKNYGVTNIWKDPEHCKQHYKEKTGYDSYWDMPNYKENLAKKHLEETGYEWHIISPEVKNKIHQTNQNNIGYDMPLCSKEIRDKAAATFKLRTGYDYTFQDPSIIEAGKNTKLERYNDETYNNREKAKQTNMFLYGYCVPSLAPEIKEKIKNSFIAHYGVDNIFKDKEFREYTKNKQIETYGDLYIRTEMFKNDLNKNDNARMKKSYETKKKNNSFASSKIEKAFNEYLLSIYTADNVFTQYKSNNYPYSCDFYIKSLNLYIELNASWTHGKHPYNEIDINDIALVNKWKFKNTKFYDQAINTWTVRDVKKRTTAKENNLNYLEIFSNDINECILQLNNYIKTRYN